MIGTDVWIVKGDFRAKYGVYKIGGGMFGTLKRTENLSWAFYGRRYVGSDRGLEATG